MVIFVLDCIFPTVQAEEDAEIEMGDSEMEDVLRHQLSHREVFLSRQYENINANTIRYIKIKTSINSNFIQNL